MPSESEQFTSQLPTLLRLLANPVTPHTVLDLWCRIKMAGWDECESVLLTELRSGDPDVQRLVMGIVVEEAEHLGTESLGQFIPLLVAHLRHEDRLVRNAAIDAVRTFEVADEEAIDSLCQIACEDDALLAREALITLIELDKDFCGEVIQLLRTRSR